MGSRLHSALSLSLLLACSKLEEQTARGEAQGKNCVRKGCGNSAEILRKIFCNDPFPNDPISELLKEWGRSRC